jgi:hypothetical protein
MKTAWSMLAAVALLFAFTVTANAEDKAEKKVTLKGTITCAKCDLKLEAKCATVIKSGDKVYYFDDASGKKYHKQICTEAKKGSVTGTVSKKGDKMIITVSELKFE